MIIMVTTDRKERGDGVKGDVRVKEEGGRRLLSEGRGMNERKDGRAYSGCYKGEISED